MKVKALQSPSPEVVGILQNIYNSPSSGSGNSPSNADNIFASQSAGSGFGQGSGGQNIFGGAQSQPTSNIFGASAQTGNIFAANSTSPSQSQNIFATNTTNLGALPFSTQQPSNIFATPQPANTNLFGANQQPSNVFATQNPAPSNNIFTSPPQNTTPQQNVFAASTPPQIFNVANQQTSAFNSPFNTATNPPSTAPPNYSASIFGNTANSNTTSAEFGNPTPQINLELYSKIEELSEEDKKWFQSKELDLNIPDQPPTYEMCFPK